MILAEEQAKTKWCPMARLNEGSCKCIASECMAWRWCERPFYAAEPMDKPYGYCGLAEKPS